MSYAASPLALTRSQRVAIALRKASRLVARREDAQGSVSSLPVGFGALLPSCDACPRQKREALGCQRYHQYTSKKPHRIDYAGKGECPSWAAIRFCPNSYDDPGLSAAAVYVLHDIDGNGGLYPFFEKAVQRLPARLVDFAGEVRAAWKRLHQERDDLEAES